MTSEMKTTIGPEDVLAIELECKCGTRLSRPVKTFRSEPRECPNCHAAWPSQDLGELGDIAYKLRGFTDGRERPFSIRFEIAQSKRL